MLSEGESECVIFGGELCAVARVYMNELTTYGVHRLEKEPSYLENEKRRLENEIQNVTVDNLSVFLTASNTVAQSAKLVSDMQLDVDSLLSSLPNLSQRSHVYSPKIRHLRGKRKANGQIVANQMKVHFSFCAVYTYVYLPIFAHFRF